MLVGIYGLASQSGHAYFADTLSRGYHVVGYNRPSLHGQAVIDTICDTGGIFLERPENTNHEESRFVPLGKSVVTNDVKQLVDNADIIIVSLPSTYHEGAVREMCEAGLANKKTPIVLSPSRSVASPYMWRILGEKYPIICLSTCPYSCKAPKPGTALIKRRKRTFIASLEGDVNDSYSGFDYAEQHRGGVPLRYLYAQY